RLHRVVASEQRGRGRRAVSTATAAAASEHQHGSHRDDGQRYVPLRLHGGSVQPKRTYSNSTGWLLMPRGGGAIQFANLPGSTTRPIRDATNARSDAEGNHLS